MTHFEIPYLELSRPYGREFLWNCFLRFIRESRYNQNLILINKDDFDELTRLAEIGAKINL